MCYICACMYVIVIYCKDTRRSSGVTWRRGPVRTYVHVRGCVGATERNIFALYAYKHTPGLPQYQYIIILF